MVVVQDFDSHHETHLRKQTFQVACLAEILCERQCLSPFRCISLKSTSFCILWNLQDYFATSVPACMLQLIHAIFELLQNALSKWTLEVSRCEGFPGCRKQFRCSIMLSVQKLATQCEKMPCFAHQPIFKCTTLTCSQNCWCCNFRLQYYLCDLERLCEGLWEITIDTCSQDCRCYKCRFQCWLHDLERLCEWLWKIMINTCPQDCRCCKCRFQCCLCLKSRWNLHQKLCVSLLFDVSFALHIASYHMNQNIACLQYLNLKT